MVLEGVGGVEFGAVVVAGEVIESKLICQIKVGDALAELGGIGFGCVAEADDGEVLGWEAVEVGAKTEHATSMVNDTQAFVVACLKAEGVGEGFT